jgi:hypothetical protein
MKYLIIFLSVLFLGVVAIAQSVTSTTLVNMQPPDAQEVAGFIKAIGGWKMLGLMGIAMGAVQAAILVIRSNFVKLEGQYTLLLVLGLSLISGVLVLTSGGMALGEAAIHSQTLAALQVFINQIWKQFVEKDDVPTLAQ